MCMYVQGCGGSVIALLSQARQSWMVRKIGIAASEFESVESCVEDEAIMSLFGEL